MVRPLVLLATRNRSDWADLMKEPVEVWGWTTARKTDVTATSTAKHSGQAAIFRNRACFLLLVLLSLRIMCGSCYHNDFDILL